MIDQTSEGGKALQAEVKLELRNYLGKDYSDDVLPLYIVVMLAHGNHQSLVAENLEAFLGESKAVAFSEWLFKHLEAHPGKYDAPKAAVKESTRPAGEESAQHEAATGKRRREKREQADLPGEREEKPSRQKDRDERREEKRRRSSDREDRHRSERHEREKATVRDRERERTRDREKDRERDGGSSWKQTQDGFRSRHELSYHDRDAKAERSGRHRERANDGLRGEDPYDRRHRRREWPRTEGSRREPDRLFHAGSRLAGRLSGAPELELPAQSPEKPGRGAKGSVFDRLEKPAAEVDVRSTSRVAAELGSKMRMDTVRSAVAERVATSPAAEEEPEPAGTKTPAPTPSQGPQEDLASELRMIRETLAKMQAEKNRHISHVVASANVRKAVVHNVHFNATPDILKAHFGGCGMIVSSIIEKDPAGNPKGVAVIEFEEEAGRRMALTLSGSMLLGRPVTVYAREALPTSSSPSFRPRAPAPAFRPRAPLLGRGAPRTPGRGRHMARYYYATDCLKYKALVQGPGFWEDASED